MNGEVAFVVTLIAGLVVAFFAAIWFAVWALDRRDARSPQVLWHQAEDALRGYGPDGWVGGDAERERYERLQADKEWLAAQRALCDSNPPPQSSWWQK